MKHRKTLRFIANLIIFAWKKAIAGEKLDHSKNTCTPLVLCGALLLLLMSAAQSAAQPAASVKVWGHNQYGKLGIGSTTPTHTTPQTVTGFDDITQFDGGRDHSVALLSNGTVVTAGGDSAGQLGDGTIGGNRTTFGAVTNGNVVNITQISAGELHNLALRSDGTVWAWGSNAQGQLGNTTANGAIPVQAGADVAGFNGRVVAIAAGFAHSLALTDDGKVWSWGWNASGQLGDGTTTNRHTPAAVLTGAGGAQLSGVVQISAGEYHSVALTSGGAVFVWGNNEAAQAGIGTQVGNVLFPAQTINSQMGTVTGVSAGAFHNVAVNTLGDVYAWGQGDSGQIGDGNPARALSPRKTGVVSNVVRVETGSSYTLARQRDGKLFAWGNNVVGQIGNGTTVNRNTPLNISAPAGTGGNLGINVAVFGAGYSHSFASSAPRSSTPAGASVLRGDQFSVAFPASTSAGTTTINVIDPTATGLTIPAGYTILANSTGYDFTTTATFTGAATVCLKVPNVIDQTIFNRLSILHDDDNNGSLDAASVTRNYQRREVCRAAASFSPFVLATDASEPTAANVSLAGRVFAPGGSGLRGAIVVLTDQTGETRSAPTMGFGYYRFADIPAGETYVLTVRSKRYSFAAQIVNVSEETTNLDFFARSPEQPATEVWRNRQLF